MAFWGLLGPLGPILFSADKDGALPAGKFRCRWGSRKNQEDVENVQKGPYFVAVGTSKGQSYIFGLLQSLETINLETFAIEVRLIVVSTSSCRVGPIRSTL